MTEDDQGKTELLPPQPPGTLSLGEEVERAATATAPELTPSERFDYPAPGMPPLWQSLADWCNQPPPSFGGNANTIHFYLNHSDGIGYQGLMFFKAATPPFSYFSRNRFYATGHVYPNVPWGELYKVQGPGGNLPAPWIRLVIALRAANGIAGLTFHQADNAGGLPGTQVGWGEEDVRDLLGNSPHFVTSFGRWVLYLELTTHLL